MFPLTNDGGFSNHSRAKNTIKTPAGAINEFKKNPEGFHYINMLSTENFPTFTIFSGNSVIEFGNWARKFKDIIECNGKWSESDKIARLKVCLDGKARRIFDKIHQAEKATLEGAINKIKENLDTTQNRELIFKALSVCKQNEGESVEHFASRLIPMIESTSRDQNGNVSEEMLCRNFLEKLSPNLQFLTRTLIGPNRKNFDILLLNAQEAELMLCAYPKTTFNPLCQITDQATSSNTIYNDEFTGDINHKTLWGSRKLKGETTHNYGRWDNQPMCSYCDKVGHFEFNCRKRQNQGQNQSLEEVADEQRIIKQMLKEQGEILNDLVSKINELTTNH
uniref:CCHC-type domain-containing protein n=1 Tax=Meloidogyne incognita TaxID=6306 RepID=A0A914N208_MELIC